MLRWYPVIEDKNAEMLELVKDELSKEFPAEYSFRTTNEVSQIFVKVSEHAHQYLDAIRCASVVAGRVYKRAHARGTNSQFGLDS